MKTYKEGFKIIKPFIFESKTISDKEKQGKAALIIDTEEETINVNIISGPAPYAEDIMFFLLGDKDVRLLIKKYQQNGHRKYKFNLRTSSGFSGREDVYINYYTDYRLQIKGKKLLHISQYEKLNEGWIEMWAGDFVELICHIYNLDAIPIKDKKGIRRLSNCKYCKGYFDKGESSREISKIL